MVYGRLRSVSSTPAVIVLLAYTFTAGTGVSKSFSISCITSAFSTSRGTILPRSSRMPKMALVINWYLPSTSCKVSSLEPEISSIISRTRLRSSVSLTLLFNNAQILSKDKLKSSSNCITAMVLQMRTASSLPVYIRTALSAARTISLAEFFCISDDNTS